MSALVLSRRVGETVLIGADIQVTVVRMGGGQVGLRIEAPRDIPVHRAEVAERIRQEARSDA
jgi:carbon storage regulator